uniref:Methionine synthase reductase n=1 Tax=Gasterosteus aculeatus aculeatus TaxID=481459 RepID=G3NDT4_GASAC
MPCEVKPRFVLLYGSQKGQAESLAEGIAEVAEEHGLAAELSCLNHNEKYNLETENAPVVFIVSTTGDGEPPDNALQFVKRIKEKTLSPDHYKHLCYALLALGDTNYANFCNCGKTIERRLQELGAKQFYATGYADDGTGLEVVVEPWIEGLWKAIKGALSKMASNKAAFVKGLAADSPRGAPDSTMPDVQLNLLRITDHSVLASRSPGASAVSASAPETPGTDDGRPRVSPPASLTRSLPPLSESSLNLPALPPPYLDVSLQEADPAGEAVGPSNVEALSAAPVCRAVQLTTGDSVKTALLVELDAHPMVTYHPGDSFDVFCPNRAAEVEEALHRLGLSDQRNHRVHVSLLKDTKKKGAQVPSYMSQNISLLYLLTWCLEIRSVPKKALLRALVEHTGHSGQRRRLQELCSRQGSADYNLYVRDCGLSVPELLAAFPTCSPPLSLLLGQSANIKLLSRLRSHLYSSCLRHPGKLRFVFSVVEFPACSWRPAGRRGLCTGWLFDLINPVLLSPGEDESSVSPAPPKIHVSLRPNRSFRPPSEPSAPFIMVGPGTGVAPFIGFLQQREQQRKDDAEAVFGETWLFFGCRHRDGDFLFREELEGFVSSGTLSQLKVCFSRDDHEEEEAGASSARPRYVQHNLLLASRPVTDILLRRGGYLYVCGDAKNMAKDVNNALMEMIQTELQVDQLEAMKTLAALREEKRYLQDIWG